jgi:hypothetical protein
MIKIGEVAKKKPSFRYTYSINQGIFCRLTVGKSLTRIGIRMKAIPIKMKAIPKNVKGLSQLILYTTIYFQKKLIKSKYIN